MESDSTLLIRRFSSIPTKPLQWLWHHRIPRGKLSLLAGDPGSGKTTLTLHLAARLSRALPLPATPPTRDAEDSPPATPDSPNDSPQSTLLLSPDDNAEDTLRPTLERFHADLDRIHTLPDFPSLLPPKPHPLDNPDAPTPLQQLDAACGAIPDLALLIIDPITHYLGLTDRALSPQNNTQPAHAAGNTCLRALAHLARKHNIAILLTTRLSKKLPDVGLSTHAIHRTLGSLAFASAARSVLLLLTPPSTAKNSPSRQRLLATIKSNLAEPPAPLAFSLTDTIDWSEHPLTPKDLIEMEFLDRRKLDPQCQAASDFLRELLLRGPTRAAEIAKAAKTNAVAPATLSRAKASLGILSVKQNGPYGTWYWKLPDDPRDPIPAPPPDADLAEILMFLENRDNLPANSPFSSRNADNLPAKTPKSPSEKPGGAP